MGMHERVCAVLNELILWMRFSRNKVQQHSNYTLKTHCILLE